MKNIRTIGCWLLLLSALVFASCDKGESTTNEQSAQNQDSAVATTSIDQPYTEVLTVPKDHYTVGQSGNVYTSRDLLYSKIHAQVTLTKVSQRNMATFSLSETKSEYVMTVNRTKTQVGATKISEEITTSDPDEITAWVLEATLAGYEVSVCYDKATGTWSGHIVKD